MVKSTCRANSVLGGNSSKFLFFLLNLQDGTVLLETCYFNKNVFILLKYILDFKALEKCMLLSK